MSEGLPKEGDVCRTLPGIGMHGDVTLRRWGCGTLTDHGAVSVGPSAEWGDALIPALTVAKVGCG